MTFDPSISLGSLVTVAAFLLGIIAALWRHSVTSAQAFSSIASLHEDIQKQQTQFAQMQVQVVEMRISLQEIAVIQSKLADGKEEMNRLDDEIKRLRQWRHECEGYIRAIMGAGKQ